MRFTYEDFKKELLDNKESFLPEELKDAEITIERVDKLNHSYDALMIRMPGSDVSASLDLEDFYEFHKAGSPEQMVGSLGALLGSLDLEKGKTLQGAGDLLADYAGVKDNLYVRCSNAVRNIEMLRNCPHTMLGDLAFTAHIGLNWEGDSAPVYTTTVTDRMLDTWGISKEDLFRDAIDNSAKRLPVYCRPLSELLSGMMKTEGPEYPEPEGGLYVLTNNQSQYGAAAVIYPGALEELQKQIGDFYMLPSSVHEFLLLSEKADVSVDALEAMVIDVNRNVLREEDFLSDQVYHYEGKSKIMEPVHDYIKRRVLAESQELKAGTPEKNTRIYPFDPQERLGKGLTM